MACSRRSGQHLSKQDTTDYTAVSSIHTEERAILRASEDNVVSLRQGPGRAETEAFLYPLVEQAAANRLTRARPGVRAILVYPLDALANDQLYYRIARLLLHELGDLRITFGSNSPDRFRSDVNRAEEERRLLDNPALVEALGQSVVHLA